MTTGTEGGALLSIGGNVGDRKALIDEAVRRLGAVPGTSVRARSSYYRTEPVGPVQQAWFLNIAVVLTTDLEPASLAATCHAVESALGRDRATEVPSGPRPIDIDVLAHGSVAKADDRAFVLVPLAEIAPDAVVDGVLVRVRLGRLGRVTGVKKLNWPVPPL